MKDTSNMRPDAVLVERLAGGGKARVTLCDSIVEGQDAEGNTSFDFERYSMETVWRDDLAAHVEASFDKWLAALKAAEESELATAIRTKRDRLLADSDAQVTIDRALKVEIPDTITTVTMLTSVKELFGALNDTLNGAWADYRQALRDVPQQPGFPRNVIWPTKPE